MITKLRKGRGRDSNTVPKPDRRAKVPTTTVRGSSFFYIANATHYSALLRRLMWDQGISIRELADRAIVGRSTVWKHVEGKINWEYTRHSTMTRLLGALGLRFEVTTRAKKSSRRAG